MMKKHDNSLFQIGEVTKILGVTRKALLVYENMGLLTPAVKDETNGFRYYSADNMTQIRSIRSLQALGLSLKEVAEYYYDTENMDKLLDKLYELRKMLDRNIQMLQVRSAKQGDFTVHKTVLPRQVCFCREYRCKDVAEAAIKLRDTYIAAARTGKMSMAARMFTVRMTDDLGILDLMCCIPVDESFDGAERMEFDETHALCIYYRGPYEGTAEAMRVLMEHVSKNGIKPAGRLRSVYLEGPPNRGDNSADKEKPCHLNKVLGRNKLSFLSTADIHSLCFFGLIPPCVSIRRLKQTKFAPFYLTRQIFYRMQCILCISNLCALHSCSCIG